MGPKSDICVSAEEGAIRISVDASAVPRAPRKRRWSKAEIREKVDAWIAHRRRQTLRLVDGGKKDP